MKVFTVTHLSVIDCSDNINVDVFDSYEKAKEKLATLFDRLVEDWHENYEFTNGNENEDVCIDRDENGFCIYENGYASHNSDTVKIMEKEVK